jgi:nuclear GTP-binding protein
MVPKKRKSKRVTLQQKYKITKRVKDHHKKLKKGALSNGETRKKQKRTENRIPNAWPYKEDLLKEIQVAKERMEEAKLRQREKRNEDLARRRGLLKNKEDEDAMDDDDEEEEENSDAESGDSEDSDNDDEGNDLGQNSRRAYLKTLRKVVEKADVILHVLDARDPLGTRSKAIEEMVSAHMNKRIVFILNKSDLVSKENLQQWVAYLRRIHPTVLFKSNTQQQRDNLSRDAGKVSKSEDVTESSHAIGAEEIIQLLKNYARNGNASSSGSHSIISVGVVGFPNVGKSSFINSLLRRRVVSVSSTPGHTKSLQEVILDKHIRLIDSPGVVFSSIHEDGDSTDPMAAGGNLLRNCVSIDEISNYMPVIEALLRRVTAPYLMQLYNIPRFIEHDATAFLSAVARAQGKLKKGGVPLLDAAAKTVLHDWNTGKIKYHTVPPELPAEEVAQEAEMAEVRKTDTQLLTTLSEGINWDNWQQQGSGSNHSAEEAVSSAKKVKSAKKGKRVSIATEGTMDTD